VSVRAQVLNLLADLVDRLRLTLVFVSHDLTVVRHVCDTIAVMHRGELVELGPAEQVAQAPEHPYTRRLVAAVPTIRGALAGRTAADLAACGANIGASGANIGTGGTCAATIDAKEDH
jgi:peptide/nickel transport system ATP-binding protein